MIEHLLLWLFIKISSRWFGTVVFATDPDTTRTTSIFFFDNPDHAKRLMDIIGKEKLDHQLRKEQHDH